MVSAVSSQQVPGLLERSKSPGEDEDASQQGLAGASLACS